MRSTVIKRLQALVIDFLCVCGYLIALAISMFLLALVLWDHIFSFTEIQMQVVVTLVTVVPVIAWFTFKESRIPFASLGKNEMELTMEYQGQPVKSALIRNILKFLPWQLAHMGVIHGYYSDFESDIGMLTVLVSIFLALTYIMQVVITPSHRHFPDIISGARVVRLPD